MELKPDQTIEFLKGLPNKLTLLRIAMIPLLFVTYPLAKATNNSAFGVITALLFLAAAVTDFLDGYFARKYQTVTVFGAVVDQIADKLLSGSALVLLAAGGVIPAFVVALLIGRDFAVSGIRLVAMEHGIRVAVNQWGKIKTVVQDSAIFSLFINELFLGIEFGKIGVLLIICALLVSLYSAFLYWREFWPKLQNQT